jgi:ferrous iron transport protein B
VHSRPNLNPSSAASKLNIKTAGPLVALVGSANSGKTTLFNLLTGSHYTTVNYPGATVEFAIGKGKVFPNLACRVMDTPGITSMVPASLDEKVTIDALFGENRPDITIVVVDTNQLSRHLYLVKQLQDLGFNIIVALTMSDVLQSKGRQVSTEKLSELLDCPVFPIDPRRKDRGTELGAFVANRLHQTQPEGSTLIYPGITTYRFFIKEMTEERVQGYYRALDEIESLVLKPADILPIISPKVARLDSVLLHPVLGLAIFIGAMFFIFTSIFWVATPFMDLIDSGFGWVIAMSKLILPHSWMTDLFADGIIGGIGSVMVFLPQILILFFAMGYFEDSGYLARGAALVDRPLSMIGLNGKSFVPLLSGYACAIPAMMAARTIPNRFERNLTIFIIPLMSCSARLPVYALLLAFITPRDKPWIGGLALTGLYISGMLLGALVSTVISRLRRVKTHSGFILELPTMRMPVFRVVVASTYHKAYQYLRKAGVMIVVISLGLWVLTHTPIPDRLSSEAGITQYDKGSGREYVAVSNSYASQLGKIIEPVMRPMGLDWRGGVAMLCAFAAREVFVSAMALMYRIDEAEGEGLADKMLVRMSEVRFEDTGKPIFTVSSVLGMILFFMIALQCLSTVAVAKHEMGGWKLPAAQLALYTGGAYLLSVALVQGLRALGVS